MRFFVTALIFWMVIFPSALGFSPKEDRTVSRSEYIAKYKDLAVRQMEATGIPASIILAQACLESGDGNSYLAKQANNHFGIKCHNWSGESISYDDDKKNECFRKYNSPTHSFQDHSDFLRYNERYSSLFNLDPKDYKGWAYGLKQKGYATNPQYANMLIKVIEDNNLTQYDYMASKLPPTPDEASVSIVLRPSKGSPLYKISLAREVLSRNNTAYIIANSYDTYSSLAKEYNLFKRELISFNDKANDAPLADGEVVYLERKRKQSAKHLDKHVVAQGETLYSLSQQYGVRLKFLYKYNNLTEGEEPIEGDIIYLRRPKKQK